jgi:hypothetical protein
MPLDGPQSAQQRDSLRLFVPEPLVHRRGQDRSLEVLGLNGTRLLVEQRRPGDVPAQVLAPRIEEICLVELGIDADGGLELPRGFFVTSLEGERVPGRSSSPAPRRAPAPRLAVSARPAASLSIVEGSCRPPRRRSCIGAGESDRSRSFVRTSSGLVQAPPRCAWKNRREGCPGAHVDGHL